MLAGLQTHIFQSDPELITVDQKGFEMGQHAAKMILKRIHSYENYCPVIPI